MTSIGWVPIALLALLVGCADELRRPAPPPQPSAALDMRDDCPAPPCRPIASPRTPQVQTMQDLTTTSTPR